MSDMLTSLFTGPVLALLIISVVIIASLWIASVVWVNRDAKARGASAGLWTAIAIIPGAGLLIYCMLRPPLNNTDSTEQAMNLELMGRQLSDYGNCPRCGEPVKKDYIACPHCAAQLRNVCKNCGRPMEPDWKMCPYCAHPLARKSSARRQSARSA